jgi:hypothetical protein
MVIKTKKRSQYRDLTSILDEAYWLQRGQFYPERHEQNIHKLVKKYPGYTKNEIDFFYRIAIHLDEVAENLANKVYTDSGYKEEALDYLQIVFFHFSSELRKDALQIHLDNLSLARNE